MKQCSYPSQFYEYGFPFKSTLSKDSPEKHFQPHVLTDYGCMEAIDIEFNESEEKFVFTAKKQKPFLTQNGIENECRFYVPSQPSTPIGEPQTLVKLLCIPNVDDLVHKKQPIGGRVSDRKHVADTEEQISNFLLDHPDVAQGIFLEQFALYFPYHLPRKFSAKRHPNKESRSECGDSIPRENMRSLPRRFPKHVDPFMFDIPHGLLHTLLSEEIKSDAKCLLFDSAYTGGALQYQHIGCKETFTYGLLLHPAGPSMSDLTLQLICVDTHGQVGADIVEENVSKVHLGSEHRSALNGRILQINTQPAFEDRSLIFAATRSVHDVLMTRIDSSNCELLLTEDGHYEKLQFTSECVKHLGVFRTNHVVTSVSVSPYINGECAVALDNGNVYLWDANSTTDAELSPAWVKCLLKCDEGWRQLEFASHPRQLLVAGRRSVDLLELCGKPEASTLYKTRAKPDEQNNIVAILSGTNFNPPNEFQFVVATPTELHLCDIRHAGAPLLSWALNLRKPCQCLAVIGSSKNELVFDLKSVILAASQGSQDIHMYQYKTQAKPKNSSLDLNNSKYSLHPPVSIAPVYGCETLKDIRRALNSRFFRSHGHLNQRLRYPIIGVTGIPFKTKSNNRAFIALHLSGCGDLISQPFHSESPKVAWKLNNILTSSQPSENERHSVTAERIRIEWATKVCENYRNKLETENPMNVRCTRTTLNTKQFSFEKFMKRFKDVNQEKSTGSCNLCQDQSEEFADAQKSPCLDTSCGSTSFISPNQDKHDLRSIGLCQNCGSDKDFVKSALRCHKQGVFHPRKLEEDVHNCSDAFWDGWSQSLEPQTPISGHHDSPVKPLNLVNPSPSEKGLGRLLWSTWNAPYEEFWDTVRDEIKNERAERKAKKYQERFDLAKSPEQLSSSENNITNSIVTISEETVTEKTTGTDERSKKNVGLHSNHASFAPTEPENVAHDIISPLLFEDVRPDVNASDQLKASFNSDASLLEFDELTRFNSAVNDALCSLVESRVAEEPPSLLLPTPPVVKLEIPEMIQPSRPFMLEREEETGNNREVLPKPTDDSSSQMGRQTSVSKFFHQAPGNFRKKSLKRKMTGFF